MAVIDLPSIRDAGTIEGKVDSLFDAYFMLTKTLTHAMSNLSSENISYINADQIDTTLAKIKTAQIEDLIVGGNVVMGADAAISWGQVTDANTNALQAWINSEYKTHIDANGVYTGTLTAQQINAVQGITLGTNATIQWANLPSLPTAEQVGAKPYDWLPAYGDISGIKPPSNADNTFGVIGADRLTYIDSHGIYTGTLTAQQINVIQGITLGANATIQWAQLPSLPSAAQVGALPINTYIPPEYTDSRALQAWVNSGYKTYLDANGVYSGTFNGGMFNINPTGSSTLPSGLTIGGWYKNSWVGQALKIQYEELGNGGTPGTVISSDGGVPLIHNLYVAFRYYVDFCGNVDFTGATVTGLNTTAKFG